MDLDPNTWPGLELVAPVSEGYRNTVWSGRVDGMAVAVRRSRRSEASLCWELDLLEFVAAKGMLVADVVPTASGERHHDGVVVQKWLDGRPPSSQNDWELVSKELMRLHAMTAAYVQRPVCSSVLHLHRNRVSVDADLDAVPADVQRQLIDVFAGFADVPKAVVHGDPMDSNIRIDDAGRVGFLDWDESRVDVVWHDLSNLGVQVLSDQDHARALQLSNAWEAVNAWTVEPSYARVRLANLR